MGRETWFVCTVYVQLCNKRTIGTRWYQVVPGWYQGGTRYENTANPLDMRVTENGTSGTS